MKVIRWKALVPAAILLVLIAVGVVLLSDLIVEQSVERAGETMVGAKVDVGEADLQLGRGSVTLRGVQVANPDSPMKNLLEAGEVVLQLQPLALLEKKIVIDSLNVRGVRFGTPRTESGALDRPSETSGFLYRRINAWASQIRIPQFSLEGLAGQVINIPALTPDSLRTLTQARDLIRRADSSRQQWEGQVRALDPRPKIDSARALAKRLESLDVRALGVAGVRDQVTAARATVDDLTGTIGRVRELEQQVKAGAAGLRDGVGALEEARRADYAYARSLVKLPSLDAPDISPALFGQAGLALVKPVLYWIGVAEEYLPPGLDPRRRLGPRRARAPGTTVEFPREREYPQFLLRYAEADLALGGAGIEAGQYQARLAGLTTQPTLYGRPLQLVAQRAGGRAGPENVRVFLQMDHTRRPVSDSADAVLTGLNLPSIPLPQVGAMLRLGEGTTRINLGRSGERLAGRLFLRTGKPVWERSDTARVATQGTAEWAQQRTKNMMWETLQRIREVEIEIDLGGSLSSPSFAVRSNVGEEISRSLKQQVGAEIQRAERQVRAKVDSLVQAQMAEVRGRVDSIRTEVEERITAQRGELEQVKSELEAKVRELATPRLPGGIRLPR